MEASSSSTTAAAPSSNHEKGPHPMDTTELLRRREALITMGVAVGAVAGVEALWRPLEADGAACLLQREVTEGPYYLADHRGRRDTRGGRPGTPLPLAFPVLKATT